MHVRDSGKKKKKRPISDYTPWIGLVQSEHGRNKRCDVDHTRENISQVYEVKDTIDQFSS